MSTDADYYVCAGDLVTWARGFDVCGQVLRRHGEKVLVLPGNHESEAQIQNFCPKYGLRNFHGQVIEVGAYQVAGLGYSNPTPFHTPGEYSEAELARRLETFAGLAPLVLICHAPPRGTALDRIRDGVHAGSTAVREFIDRYQPERFFCGHIHEAAGSETTIGKTKAVNVGKRGYLLELG